jgi:hypothetical protein
VAQALRAYPRYLTINDPLETLGMSSYNALQVLLQKRDSAGLHVTVAYTWSKNKDPDANALLSHAYRKPYTIERL